MREMWRFSGDELQKMILRLEEQTELLKKEKMSLADSLARFPNQIVRLLLR